MKKVREKTFISVVMSTNNDEKYIESSIESILSQTFSDFEFIIVNDGSTDKTNEIIETYSKKDSRIITLINKDKIGLTKSLIKGIDICRGKYIARQDADDISISTRFEAQVACFNDNPRLGLLGTGITRINDQSRILEKPAVIVSDKVIKQHLDYGNVFAHGSIMMKKKVYFEAGGYNSFFRFAQDLDLWLRIAKISEVGNLPERLYLWRDLKSNISNKSADDQVLFSALAIYSHKRFVSDVNDFLCSSEFSIDEAIKYFDDKIFSGILGHLYFRRNLLEKAECFLKESDLFKDRVIYFLCRNRGLFILFKRLFQLFNRIKYKRML
jgi:glycosyltransferase involved in cell wall biosynthesis